MLKLLEEEVEKAPGGAALGQALWKELYLLRKQQQQARLHEIKKRFYTAKGDSQEEQPIKQWESVLNTAATKEK